MVQNKFHYAITGQTAAEIISGMARLRNVIDELETQVDDRRWPLPKYREMLFIY